MDLIDDLPLQERYFFDEEDPESRHEQEPNVN